MFDNSATAMRASSRMKTWGKVLVFFAIASLIVGLATRFCTPPSSSPRLAHSVKVQSPNFKKQHLDRDATQWVRPTADFAILPAATHEQRRVPAATRLPDHLFSQSLYNRPPPSANFAFSS
jgi:hypothetical protein